MQNTTGRSRLWDTIVDLNNPPMRPDPMRGLLDPAFYVVGIPCPTCEAPAWHRCTLRGKEAAAGHGHARRLDKGHSLYSQDVGKAPWPEERVDGVLYTSLSFFGLTAERHAALDLPDLDPTRTQPVKPGKGQPVLPVAEANARFKAGL